MKNILALVLAGSLLSISANLKCQDTCGFGTTMNRFLQAYPNYYDSLNLFESNYRQVITQRSLNTIADKRIIPVVFHIFHNNGPENISDSQINEALSQMNAQFAGLEGGIDTKDTLSTSNYRS
ncbi:MAG: hypothetical protein ACK41Z_10345 [Sediminibacterium sp.]